MSSNHLMQQLRERGLIAQVTKEKALANRLAQGPVALYCGFDPTADSLHIGHLVPLLCLKHFQLAGHRPVTLIGGATGLIGDPSFRSTERKRHPAAIVQEWIEKIKQQVSLFLDFDCGANSAIVVNNYDWLHTMDVLTFLCNIGTHFSVNQILNKDAVKQRLQRNNSGVSFTELSYNLLQGYDFAYLTKQYGVALQIGGSDQWGNIISGIDLTRRLYQKTVFGLTVALLTKADGTKFGKTEEGAVWLDPSKTSPYKFYQFWINITDSDVYRLLKLLTFFNVATIDELEQADSKSEQAPRAQSVIAEEMTRMVHGALGLAAAKRITSSLFTGAIVDLTENDFAQLAQDGMPTVSLEHGANLKQALVATELVLSLSQARTMIAANAVAVNGEKQVSTEYVFNDADKLYGRYTIIRRGKKNYFLLCW